MRLVIILLIFVNTMFAFDMYTQALDQSDTTNPFVKQNAFPTEADIGNIGVVSLIASAAISGSVWIEDGATSCAGTAKLAETTVNVSAVDSTILSNANSDSTITDTEYESMVENVFLSSEVATSDLTDSSTYTICLSHDGSGGVAATSGGQTALDPGFGDFGGGEIPIDADDINGDGILDSTQSIVVESVQTSIGSIGVSNALGTITCDQSAVASTDILNGAPAGFTSPYGKIKVDIANAVANNGDTATITLNLPSASVNQCYKYNNSTLTFDKIACTITTSNGRTIIKYDVEDGGDYDGGGADKDIIDPIIIISGSSSNSVNAPISPLAYIVLAFGILFIGVRESRSVGVN